MAANAFSQLKTYLDTQIIGQPELTQALLIAILADGHLLVEGPPGLAKTRAVNALAKGIEGSFQRVQFTPDLLPADVTGTDIYRQQTSEFVFEKGPLFHNLILADEINRAPAKVQSALLEAMAERQVTVGKNTYPLSELFLVMATQNPLEQEGTYPLPEAQLDRFLLHLSIDYPGAEHELDILRLTRGEALNEQQPVMQKISQSDLFAARKEILGLYLAEPLEQYLVQLIIATREGAKLDAQLGSWIEFGASPRATIALDKCARAHAWLQGRDFVAPDDIQAVVHNVLRHRIILSYEAQADGITKDQVISRIVELVAVP
ncbi:MULTISPECIES: AAA family ATPase [Pseudoalteromonas]|jgi:MoxR-like ATPase|uniref:ATPase AAA n=1 Tax=Pseudoalteromonas fuliginea TaxID=1872678 RepID=A0A063KS65_9GAMM|nr:MULTISPECIES: MoxR family ATPase [Pseudoalteromonas]ALQ08866.1 AAA family ATPase [Pseudoalteromonas sp. Bsw20308]ATG76943.1 AAA family ATPase [Pseudoalteromonas sp. 1_2015MBL_MicDiv]KAA1154122.1 MoxR family ATPase [Pseudoalteromonas fuliginea]KAA1163896.1 MoxR family ATPase [Pseudoalteromonas fuliginea]KAA1166740.1 MoxR family ATPase [Pseudoalteromonas fuliginea]|tara:strand:- start:11547 stop:12503 length:957 start_codon:yes stop_codon:yes gene_type:complete